MMTIVKGVKQGSPLNKLDHFYDSIKNTEDNTWLLVLHLREICSLVCAPALSIGQVALLQEKINEYLFLRLKYFPDIKLRPKHHFISHYPSLIVAFGPLKHLWTLRFESKHKYFKNIIKHAQNFKNATKLLSQKHQFLQSQCSKDTYSSLVEADNAKEYIPENFNMDISSVITDYFCDNRNENCKYYTHYMNVYFVGTTIEVIYNSDFGIYEPFEIKGQEYNTDKILLYPYSSLLISHSVLETRLNSIPMSYLFKVWSANRKQKVSLIINSSENILSELIAKSNIKLGITGSILVMEKDGTVVDENDVLKLCCAETFMLLQSDESWSPENALSHVHSMASCDTISLTSNLSESGLSGSSSPHEDGNRFGDGIHTLYLKLCDRNSYLNRPHMKRSLIQTLNIPEETTLSKIEVPIAAPCVIIIGKLILSS
ncbi:hypothetical protein ALC60_08935 [Trachymyrmex zeteki]|uniref:CIDE-N domain-containing protein n=1 Tax=Mycetomoellerius zeteki TaxID=64791 RepID=A0A151WW10_9HYME|nr:hypothetical protein ALC60_08935 [Trachymyrmex zeteki]